MKEIIAILAIVGLLVFGAYMAASALDSAAFSFSEGQRHQAYATVTVAGIEAQTKIRIQELQMIENAYTRSLFAVLFWPVAAIISLFMAAGMWFMVWKESRRQKSSGYESGGGYRYCLPDSHQFPVQRYSDFERETLQMEKEYRQRYG